MMSLNPTGGRVLVVGATFALLLSACGASATPKPAASFPFGSPAASAAATPGTNTGPATPATSAAPTDAATTPAPTDAVETPATGGSTDPIGALADLTSYKIKMSIESTGITSGIGQMGAITMDGTVILKPAKAADMKMSVGGLEIRAVEINGKSYVDMGTGLIESTGSETSMVDSLSPEKMFGSMSAYVSQMKVVGDETKNGIATTHIQATQEMLDAAGASLGSAFGLEDGKWSMDAWVAKDGGYAVSYVLKATGKSAAGAEASISMSLDLSNVNDPTNVVKGP